MGRQVYVKYSTCMTKKWVQRDVNTFTKRLGSRLSRCKRLNPGQAEYAAAELHMVSSVGAHLGGGGGMRHTCLQTLVVLRDLNSERGVHRPRVRGNVLPRT